ncbi:MAG: right-handed parallel beta-helix repeat-containing protein [Anaerolineales bacterium]|nr:right-handed parallel beta-helix repeat-containing protein [Anaerolineales bacterium]
MIKTILTWIGRVFATLLGLLALALLVAAFRPVPRDEVPAVYGAGASSVQPSTTGLLRAFPELNSPVDNPQTAEKVALGRLLFFDPVLSDNNEMSCASCHHPDLGFADGRQLAQGVDGETQRNALSLWNVAYSAHFFWDGRAPSLEEQVLVPLEHPNEMQVSDRGALEAELEAIPEYVQLFDAAFPGQRISVKTVQQALAAFERTLTSQNSPFDAYAAGDLQALTASQRRGFALFRSAATRCFECHTAPTFGNDTFRITGVADLEGQEHDPGRSAVGDAPDGAFKVPTLRNIVLSAPYMHNGIFASLEEVIDFYAGGGGRADGVQGVDPLIRPFELTDQEKSDLIAFLYSLTDESQLPMIPTEVPSGLPVVARIENPERNNAAEINAPGSGETVSSGSGAEIVVQPDETIQAAVDRARPGDTVLIPYGLYHERVVVDLNDITILGVPNDAGENPVLDGEDKLTEAVIASGNNFEIGYLDVKNYTDNGVIVEGVANVHMHHIYAEKTGTYGLYPVQSTGVLIEDSEVTGADDAGIYAGQSEDVVIRNNIVHGNVLGIEAENTVNAELYGNHAYNNTCGILVVLLPHLTSRISLNTQVYDNLIEANNHSNFAKDGTAAAIMPPGTGIALIASDKVEVYGNTVKDNNTGGIGIFSLTIAYAKDEIDVGDRPEDIYIHDNQLINNGQQPDPFLAQLGVPGSDILWDVSGAGLRVDQPEEGLNVFPPLLPSSSWGDWAYRMYWHALNFVIGLVS